MMETAKLFWSGRSQAIRLPKEFRFDGDEVRIRRHGSGVILEPIALASAVMVEIGGERRAGATGDESGAGAPR